MRCSGLACVEIIVAYRTFSYSIGHIEQVTDATKRGNIDYQPTFLLYHHLSGVHRTYIVVPEKEINL